MANSALIDQDFKIENNIQISDQVKVSLANPDHFLSSVSDQKRLTKTKLRMVPDVLSRTGCGLSPVTTLSTEMLSSVITELKSHPVFVN